MLLCYHALQFLLIPVIHALLVLSIRSPAVAFQLSESSVEGAKPSPAFKCTHAIHMPKISSHFAVCMPLPAPINSATTDFYMVLQSHAGTDTHLCRRRGSAICRELLGGTDTPVISMQSHYYHELSCESQSIVNRAARLSEKMSILPPLRSTLRSCEYLHLKPLVHWPCLKNSHTTDLGSTPASEVC